MLAVKPDAAEGACRALGVDRGDPRALHRGRRAQSRASRPRSGGEPVVVRAMPNTPALVGAGVTAISGGSFATSQDLAWAEDVLSAVGTVVRLPERLLDAVTGLSGSGPAYFFLVAEALMEAGVQMGLDPRGEPDAGGRDDARLGRAAAGDGPRPRGPARHGDLAGGDHGRRHPDPRGPRRALGLHGGGGGRHRAIAQPAALSAVAMTSEPPRTVFFLSDFGTEDEFAGVVHAVIAARAPGTTVIDLTHHIPPFDVRAGSHTLVRAVPHLGPGVVLGVVDPGVGTAAPGHRAGGARCPRARPCRSSGPTTGCSWPRPRRRPRRRSPAWWSWRARRRRPTGARPSTGATCSRRPRPPSAPAPRSRSWASRSTRRRWCASSAAWSRRAGCTTAAPACAPRSPGSTTSATCNWRRRWPTPAWPASR